MIHRHHLLGLACFSMFRRAKLMLASLPRAEAVSVNLRTVDCDFRGPQSRAAEGERLVHLTPTTPGTPHGVPAVADVAPRHTGQ